MISNQKIEFNLEVLMAEAKKCSVSALASKYGVSATTIRKNLKAARASQPVSSGVQDRIAEATSPSSLFDEYFDMYRKAIGWTKDPVPPVGSIVGPQELTVVAGDTHAPYEHEDAIKWMVRRTALKAKRIILAGDLADMFNFSRYPKFKRHYDAMEEIIRVQALLNMFSESYEEVILMTGNHDDRFIKFLQRMGLPPEVFEVFDYMHGQYSLHPIFVLARNLKNVKIVEPVIKDYASFGYLHQQGDAIISHAEKYSSICNKAVAQVIQSLKSYHEVQGLIKPFKVVIQAHTHQAGKTFNDFGVVGIENGCLCLTPDYAGDARRIQTRASILGYTELVQTNGVSDLEKTNFIPFQV
jgi:hypothetical protein